MNLYFVLKFDMSYRVRVENRFTLLCVDIIHFLYQNNV